MLNLEFELRQVSALPCTKSRVNPSLLHSPLTALQIGWSLSCFTPSPGRDSSSVLGSLFQFQITLSMKKIFWISHGNLPCTTWGRFLCVLSLWFGRRDELPTHYNLSGTCREWEGSPGPHFLQDEPTQLLIRLVFQRASGPSAQWQRSDKKTLVRPKAPQASAFLFLQLDGRLEHHRVNKTNSRKSHPVWSSEHRQGLKSSLRNKVSIIS